MPENIAVLFLLSQEAVPWGMLATTWREAFCTAKPRQGAGEGKDGRVSGRAMFQIQFLSFLFKKISIVLAYRGFFCGSNSKESACNAGGMSSIPGLGRSLAKRRATHSSILAWRIP